MELTQYLQAKCALIEAQLAALVPEGDTPYNILFQAARYSLLGPAKRIRPILTLAVTEALGGDENAALTPACALEMIHTYSLIHDDLPCMDNDDFRRGKPSLHKAFQEGQAVLTGDFLLTYAFEVLTQAPRLSTEQRLQLISVLARNAGSDGMIGGQVMDLNASGHSVSFEGLRLIHNKKTGSLITAAVEFGGIIAQAKREQLELIRLFGSEIGLAFQIVDDILDVTASQQKHGALLGSDARNQKTTTVSILGIDSARALANKLLRSGLDHLRGIAADTKILASLATSIVKR